LATLRAQAAKEAGAAFAGSGFGKKDAFSVGGFSAAGLALQLTGGGDNPLVRELRAISKTARALPMGKRQSAARRRAIGGTMIKQQILLELARAQEQYDQIAADYAEYQAMGKQIAEQIHGAKVLIARLRERLELNAEDGEDLADWWKTDQ